MCCTLKVQPKSFIPVILAKQSNHPLPIARSWVRFSTQFVSLIKPPSLSSENLLSRSSGVDGHQQGYQQQTVPGGDFVAYTERKKPLPCGHESILSEPNMTILVGMPASDKVHQLQRTKTPERTLSRALPGVALVSVSLASKDKRNPGAAPRRDP